MRSTRQIRREARQLFRFCCLDGLLNEPRTRQVVQQLLASRRRGTLALLSEFHRLVRLDHDAHSAKVETASPLPPDLRAEVQTRLRSRYGMGIDIRFSQNPMLIGGMRVKVGSDVFDGSVQWELAALAKRLGITAEDGRSSEPGPRPTR